MEHSGYRAYPTLKGAVRPTARGFGLKKGFGLKGLFGRGGVVRQQRMGTEGRCGDEGVDAAGMVAGIGVCARRNGDVQAVS